jgi:hypothetical protein
VDGLERCEPAFDGNQDPRFSAPRRQKGQHCGDSCSNDPTKTVAHRRRL